MNATKTGAPFIVALLLALGVPGAVHADGPQSGDGSGTNGVIKSEVFNPQLTGGPQEGISGQATGGAAGFIPSSGTCCSGVVRSQVFNPQLSGGQPAVEAAPAGQVSSGTAQPGGGVVRSEVFNPEAGAGAEAAPGQPEPAQQPGETAEMVPAPITAATGTQDAVPSMLAAAGDEGPALAWLPFAALGVMLIGLGLRQAPR